MMEELFGRTTLNTHVSCIHGPTPIVPSALDAGLFFPNCGMCMYAHTRCSYSLRETSETPLITSLLWTRPLQREAMMLDAFN